MANPEVFCRPHMLGGHTNQAQLVYDLPGYFLFTDKYNRFGTNDESVPPGSPYQDPGSLQELGYRLH